MFMLLIIRAHTLRAGHYFELFGIENRVATTTYRLMNMSVTNSTFGDRRKIGFSYMYDKLRWTVAGEFSAIVMSIIIKV